jgi:Protein of unknown function (DUF1566)
VAFDGAVSGTNLHDADNVYPWNGTCSITGTECGTNADCASPSGQMCNAIDGQGTGLTVFGFAAALNASNFAGHNDWRIPNVRELLSIVDYANANPTLAPAFNGSGCGSSCTDLTSPTCSCPSDDFTWSSTRLPPTNTFCSPSISPPAACAFGVFFGIGITFTGHGSAQAVRAVRNSRPGP